MVRDKEFSVNKQYSFPRFEDDLLIACPSLRAMDCSPFIIKPSHLARFFYVSKREMPCVSRCIELYIFKTRSL